jgi:hypothetical protein
LLPTKEFDVNAKSWITTDQLAEATAGGIDFIRTKDNKFKGLALRPDMNERAPRIVVVGKGPRIEDKAERFAKADVSIPVYLKRGTNAWEYIGNYRAVSYRTDAETISQYRGSRQRDTVAGILFLDEA